MGDLIAMRRKIDVSVRRFGRQFELTYFAGPTPETSDPSAMISIDGVAAGPAEVLFHDPEDWNEINLVDLPDEYQLLDPEDLGINVASGDLTDHRFLTEAEQYVLTLLNAELARKLRETSRSDEPLTEEEVDEALSMTPVDRGRRVVSVWHNHGAKIDHLPMLIAVEIYDALDHMGGALGELLDESKDVERGDCGPYVRAMVTKALTSWKEVEESD